VPEMCIKSAKIYLENNYPQYPHFFEVYYIKNNVDMLVYITFICKPNKTTLKLRIRNHFILKDNFYVYY